MTTENRPLRLMELKQGDLFRFAGLYTLEISRFRAPRIQYPTSGQQFLLVAFLPSGGIKLTDTATGQTHTFAEYTGRLDVVKLPKLVGIMKVADIYAGTVSEPVRWFLHRFRTYSDTVLKEHLLNISDAVEAHDQTPVLSPEATEELAHIAAMCAEIECGYVRFIS